MKIFYTDGPPSLTAGSAGQFINGEPKEVDDKIAVELLKKPPFKEFKKNKEVINNG